MLENKIAFCRPGGSLNPQTSPNAVTTLQGIAGGYKGVSGIEAVKMYLSDVFMKAVGSLDANVDDDKGGRKTSWQQCIGMKIADPYSTDVAKNSINDVIDREQDTKVDAQLDPVSFNRQNSNATRRITLTFKIINYITNGSLVKSITMECSTRSDGNAIVSNVAFTINGMTYGTGTHTYVYPTPVSTVTIISSVTLQNGAPSPNMRGTSTFTVKDNKLILESAVYNS